MQELPPSGDDVQLPIPTTLDGGSRGTVRELIEVLLDSDRQRTALVSEVTALQERITELERQARTDPLTGLLNRGGLDEALRREEARARRFGSAVAVALCDVDDLKAVNDRYGHHAGDRVLRAVATTLRASVRASDLVGRLGGDEFVVLLLGTDSTGARVLVERARGALQAVELPDGSTIPVRFSAGIATRDESGTLTAAVEVADQRLLMDKQRHHA